MQEDTPQSPFVIQHYGSRQTTPVAAFREDGYVTLDDSSSEVFGRTPRTTSHPVTDAPAPGEDAPKPDYLLVVGDSIATGSILWISEQLPASIQDPQGNVFYANNLLLGTGCFEVNKCVSRFRQEMKDLILTLTQGLSDFPEAYPRRLYSGMLNVALLRSRCSALQVHLVSTPISLTTWRGRVKYLRALSSDPVCDVDYSRAEAKVRGRRQR